MKKKFFKYMMIICALGMAVFGYSFFIEPQMLQVKKYSYHTKTEVKPFKIVFITDTHTGSRFNGLDRLQKIVDKANALQPDIILLGGDFVIKGVLLGNYVDIEKIAPILKKLQAPMGVYAVMGNHEYWDDYNRIEKTLKANNIPVLKNENIQFNDFNLIGIDDAMTKHSDVRKSFQNTNKNKANIILTHCPDVFPKIKEKGLILAGHTHAGQISLFGWTPIVPSKYGSKYAKGRIDEDDKTLIVSNGIGTSMLPLRFLSIPQIIVIDVKK